MTTHETETRSWRRDRSRKHHASVCSCGWESPTRTTRKAADEDARTHREGGTVAGEVRPR